MAIPTYTQNHNDPDSPFVMQAENSIKEELRMNVRIQEKIDDGSSRNDNNYDINNDDHSKQRFIDILTNAGEVVTEDIEAKLPTWGEVKDLYGSQPVIMGLDTCQAYQNNPNIAPADRSIGIAGLMNTGTHMLHKVLQGSCQMPDRKFDVNDGDFQSEEGDNDKHRQENENALKFLMDRKDDLESGIMFDVPWNKHAPEYFRSNNMLYDARRRVIQNEHVLPIVVVKDPYHWFNSMCRHPYIVKFPGWNKHKHCPLFVPNDNDSDGTKSISRLISSGKPASVKIRRRDENDEMYNSLAHYWNEWNDAYVQAKTYPRIIVRYEDLLVHLHETVTKICECAGGKVTTDHIQHVKGAAKTTGHTNQRGLASALIHYLHDESRTPMNINMDATSAIAEKKMDNEGFHMTFDDLEYAKRELDPQLMKAFGYKHPGR